jgi:hypothetical protein
LLIGVILGLTFWFDSCGRNFVNMCNLTVENRCAVGGW